MSTAELKLQLIRQIDQLPPQRLLDALKFLRSLSDSPKKLKYNRRIGTLKGTLLYMAPDFDEPLEDFQDYM